MDSTRTLYAIISREKLGSATDSSLAAACERMDIKYKHLIVEDEPLDGLQKHTFNQGDLLYRVSITPKAATIESALVLLHAQTLTAMYREITSHGPTRQFDEFFMQIAAGIPVIPSLIVDDTWLARTTDSVQKSIDSIGGFPVVLKVLGMSHGQGVQKHDELASFSSAVHDAVKNGFQAIARYYLADYRHYRVIVIDRSAVAAIEYHKPSDDFRTNAQETPNVSAVKVDDLSGDVLDIAISSVELAGSILGGVDVLVDASSGKAYLAEVNVPCNYSRAEAPTGIDISGLLIEALIHKSQQK